MIHGGKVIDSWGARPSSIICRLGQYGQPEGMADGHSGEVKQHNPAGQTAYSNRSNNTIQQDKQHIPAGQTKKSSRTNNIKTSIRK